MNNPKYPCNPNHPCHPYYPYYPCPPKPCPPVTCPQGTFAYTIRPGDTYFSLAIRYGTTVEAIMMANPGVDPNRLYPGQVICIPMAMPPVVCPPGTFEYTVQAGDTFFSLAQRFNTTVAAIQAANPGVDPNNLRVGQKLCIPMAMPPVTCPPGTFSYTIQAGDTYFSLAQRFNTTVAAIQAANPGVDPNNLQIGQRICIPTATPTTCPPGTFSYTIQAGDTFFSLAQRYNTTVAAIQAANPGVDPNTLQIGQRICIPTTTPTTCPPGTFSYVIQAGDTFFSLAQRYNTTVAAIQAANPGVDPNNLQIGQRICIPTATPVTCPPGTFVYVIQSGDTYFNLAQRYNTTVAAIQAANPNVDPNNLQIGQRICIPNALRSAEVDAAQTCPTGTFSYTIKSGDTFYNLAQRYNTTVAAIQAANPGVNPNALRIGQVICIPQSQPTTCPTGTFSYTIKSGDTFYNLAQRYNTTVSAIQSANPAVDPNALRIGQIICIPQNQQPVTCPEGTLYTIKSGDTFYNLAQRYNTTVSAIQSANPGVDPNALRIGQVICIPRS